MTDDLRDLTAEEAFRLKQSINRKITYGHTDLTAPELQALDRMTDHDWKELVAQRAYSLKRDFWLPPWFWYACLIAGGLALYFYKWTGPGKIGGVAVLLAILRLATREGYAEGFGLGFEGGHDHGIRKALGISDDDARDAHDRAIDMEIEEHVIAGFDKKKAATIEPGDK